VSPTQKKPTPGLETPSDAPGQVVFRESPIHGTGAAALGCIPAGTRILEYLGRKITKAEASIQCDLGNPYIFELDEVYDLDGDVGWNPARWLNHSCGPNCESLLEEGRIWIVTLREIQSGEELTFNYGYSLNDFKEHPCHCGSAECVGYIVDEEFFAELRGIAGPSQPPR